MARKITRMPRSKIIQLPQMTGVPRRAGKIAPAGRPRTVPALQAKPPRSFLSALACPGEPPGPINAPEAAHAARGGCAKRFWGSGALAPLAPGGAQSSAGAERIRSAARGRIPLKNRPLPHPLYRLQADAMSQALQAL